ncbi:hypothetical protein CTI12_AA079110 [Artemisia annua]|uniref:Uncharacterized protein n=1 Tax=Artemisia annua TaxID=35608 RepID=A0A2U1Q3A3_ARTAN|nr:hypothetical protein CTI12_AA079110 [Artemisia annua]
MMMERGSKYKAYADLRESRLRMKLINNQPTQPLENNHFINNVTPLKKQAKLQGQRSFQATTINQQKGTCVLLTPSVPNSSINERKKLVEPLVQNSSTLPIRSLSKINENNSRLRGSKSSLNSPEKRKSGIFTAIRSSRRSMQTWMK